MNKMNRVEKCEVCGHKFDYVYRSALPVWYIIAGTKYAMCNICSSLFDYLPDGKMYAMLDRDECEELAERVLVEWMLNCGTARRRGPVWKYTYEWIDQDGNKHREQRNGWKDFG